MKYEVLIVTQGYYPDAGGSKTSSPASPIIVRWRAIPSR